MACRGDEALRRDDRAVAEPFRTAGGLLIAKRTLAISATFAGAIVAGGLLALIVTLAGRAIGTPASPAATGSETAAGETPPQTFSATPLATESASTRPSVTPSNSATPSATAVGDVAVTNRCFIEGMQQPEGEPMEPVEAEDLASRLPWLSPMSDRNAWVGSSLTSGFGGAYVNGFEVCLGADPATIRWGRSGLGSVLGVLPMAAQVDGFTGAELAAVLIEGLLPAEQLAALETREHDGWTYRYVPDWGFAVTASADTVFWMQAFCCVDGTDDDAELPTFEEIIEHYLDETHDEPAAWTEP